MLENSPELANDNTLSQKLASDISSNKIKGPLALNGPFGVGKSIVLKDITTILNKENNYNIINFNFLDIKDTNRLLYSFFKMMMKKIKKAFPKLKIAKQNNKSTKELIRKKFEVSAQENLYNAELQNDAPVIGPDPTALLFIDFLESVNKYIVANETKLVITFDNLMAMELYDIPKLFNIFKYFKAYLTDVIVITTMNLEFIALDFEDESIRKRLTHDFEYIVDVEEQTNYYQHANPLIRRYIEVNDIKNKLVVDAIDLSVRESFKTVLAAFNDMHESKNFDKLMTELEFLFWFYNYVLEEHPELQQVILKNILFAAKIQDVKYEHSINDRDKHNFRQFAVLDKIEEFVNMTKYEFESKDHFKEIINIINQGWYANFPIKFYSTKGYQDQRVSLNRYYPLFMFDTSLELEKISDDNKGLRIVFDENKLAKPIRYFLEIMDIYGETYKDVNDNYDKFTIIDAVSSILFTLFETEKQL